MKVYQLRTTDESGKNNVWWLFDDSPAKRLLKGKPKESRQQTRERWKATFNEPITGVIRFPGIMQRSVAAMTVMSEQENTQ